MHPEIVSIIETLIREAHLISDDRQQLLKQLSTYLIQKKQTQGVVRMNFICTHNSRRSIMAQVWASTAAAYFQLSGVYTYSGGTEVTAFNPRAVAALGRAGFQVEHGEGENPHYLVRFGKDAEAITCFSKLYDDVSNPRRDFAAVMTCSDADANCPFIPGAEVRISLPYEDPKAADGTSEEEERYNERFIQIGRELIFAFYLASKSMPHYE